MPTYLDVFLNSALQKRCSKDVLTSAKHSCFLLESWYFVVLIQLGYCIIFAFQL